jgi:hypothetical protein
LRLYRAAFDEQRNYQGRKPSAHTSEITNNGLKLICSNGKDMPADDHGTQWRKSNNYKIFKISGHEKFLSIRDHGFQTILEGFGTHPTNSDSMSGIPATTWPAAAKIYCASSLPTSCFEASMMNFEQRSRSAEATSRINSSRLPLAAVNFVPFSGHFAYWPYAAIFQVISSKACFGVL